MGSAYSSTSDSSTADDTGNNFCGCKKTTLSTEALWAIIIIVTVVVVALMVWLFIWYNGRNKNKNMMTV